MLAAKLFRFYLAVILIWFVGSTVWAKCESCHPQEAGVYLHSPYTRHKCEACHGGFSSSGEKVDLSEVKWFSKGTLQQGISLITVPHLLQKKVLVFQSASPQKIFVLDPGTAQNLEPNTQPLKILQIKTCGVKNELWWEAKICLEFNQPAEAEISCGNLYEYHDHLSSFHRITLAGLQEGKTYSCSLKGRNLWGQESEKKFSFEVKSQPEATLQEAREIEAVLYRLPSGELIIQVESDGTFFWRLGELPYRPTNPNLQGDHPVLNSPLKASLEVCYRCHPDQKSGVTHPVKVPLKKGMKKTDLPLEGGLVTCISCHVPHSGNMPYLLRKENTALCLSCHDDRYYR